MTAQKKTIRILHLEDNPDDVELLNLVLRKSKLKYDLEAIAEVDVFLKVDLNRYDIVISDYNLGNYDGLSAIKHIRMHSPSMPVILLSGTVGEELAVDLLREGANDFVLKSNLKKIPISIERAIQETSLLIEKHKFQNELVEKNLILDTIFDNFEDLIFLKDVAGKYLKVNRAFCDFFNLHEAEILNGVEIDFFPEEISQKALENDEFVKLSGKSVSYELEFIDSSGVRKVLDVVKTPIIKAGTVTGIVGQCRDVTTKKILLEETIKAKSILSQAEKLTTSGSFEYDSNLDVLLCSSNFKHLLKLQIAGDTISFRKFTQMIKAEDREIFDEGISKAIENYEEYHNEHRFLIQKDRETAVAYIKVVLRPDYKDEKGVRFYGTLVDVSEEHINQIRLLDRQEEERSELARELHDNLGQKMNAISMFSSKISDSYPENKDMAKVKLMAHEAIDDLGYLINNISVKQIEEHSLQYAIDKLIGYIPDKIKVEKKFDFKEDEISKLVKSQLYRVIQEGLNNITKYSEATEVKLSLRQDGSLLSLNINDNGKGFSLDKNIGGNGLQNITHRIQRVNGLIHIESKEGEGASIQIKVPIS